MFTPAFRRFVWAGCALFAAAGTPACTLFGAVGEGMVEGGGTLAAKTRDEHPGPQRFDIAVPSKGYAYLGLFTGDKHRFNMASMRRGSSSPVQLQGAFRAKSGWHCRAFLSTA